MIWGDFIGILSGKTKVAHLTEPGEKLFMVIGENADFMKATLEAGKTYYALKTEKPVTGAEPLEDVGFGGCMTGSDDAAAIADAKARFPAQAVDGIDASVAFVVPSRWPRYVFYSGPSRTIPPEVERLLNH